MEEFENILIVTQSAQHCNKALHYGISWPGTTPEREILHFVKEKKIDLLVLLTHAEGHLEQMLFEHLNEKIHHKLPCSIMFVKHEPRAVKQSFCLRADRVQPCEV